ncbi:SOS response-associated peptidase [Leptospira kmetyi]|uniref:SOS response-associated peptidase n=1 Tax=Leptospira kmetyi TaxID=408139 RepID=UPI003EB76D9D
MKRFSSIDLDEDLNIYPRRHTYFIHRDLKKEISISNEAWGVKPYWSKDMLTCTRSERMFESAFWRPFALTQRCLIPASCFFEWHKRADGKKEIYRIQFKKTDSFCFGGLFGLHIEVKKESFNYSPWITILTQEGNSLMKEVHNSGENQGRQPIVIRESDMREWLSPNTVAPNQIYKLIYQYPESAIEAEPDHPQENSVGDQLNLF